MIPVSHSVGTSSGADPGRLPQSSGRRSEMRKIFFKNYLSSEDKTTKKNSKDKTMITMLNILHIF